MSRHYGTKGNDLMPNRVDAQEDVTVPDGNGGRVSVSNITTDVKNRAVQQSLEFNEGIFPQLY
jgi:hypothetical protein